MNSINFNVCGVICVSAEMDRKNVCCHQQPKQASKRAEAKIIITTNNKPGGM